MTVAVFSATASLPNSGVVLNRVVRRSVDRGPGATLVVGSGDEHVPDTIEIPIFVGSAGRIGDIRPDEPTGSPTRAPANRLSLGGVNNAVADAHIDVANPSLAVVGADRNVRVTLGAALILYIAIVGGAVCIQAD